MRANGAIEGAAAGFAVGDEVIVLKRYDNTVVKVIGHVDGIRRCTVEEAGKYYIFYLDGTTLKVANCAYGDNGIEVINTKTGAEVSAGNSSNAPITFRCKRFTHNVAGVEQDLYFIATSLYINPNPSVGWVNFAAANPTFPLVTNNANTKIPMTTQVLADLNAVNELVNTTHAYSGETGGDNWKVMADGETGDCEDFALTKAKLLLDKGYPASALHIETAFIEGSLTPNVGHAWLVAQTTGGDYALDSNSNEVVLNSSLKFGDKNFFGRRRQIGSNWAFISPFGWLLNSENQASPYSCWYILDPLLNIFYIIDPINTFNELFASVSDVGDENSTSSPSINFSSDNNSIYVASGGNIKTFRLDENKLTLVNTQPYTVKGFVGRDGQIVEGVGLYGRQDPSNYGVGNADVGLTLTDGIYNISYIAPSRLGDFKCLYACEVVSENGYYSYNYRYLTGTFSHVDSTFLIEWDDLDNPNTNYHHEKSVGTTSDPVINKYKYHYNSFMGKTLADTSLYLQMELLDHLLRPYGYQYPLSSQSADYYIFGEIIPFYTSDPIPVPYDPRKPFTWNHVEIGEELIFRGVLLNRTTDMGDNLKRMYKNGASCLGVIAAAVGVAEGNILGLTYIPSTDRLNK